MRGIGYDRQSVGFDTADSEIDVADDFLGFGVNIGAAYPAEVGYDFGKAFADHVVYGVLIDRSVFALYFIGRAAGYYFENGVGYYGLHIVYAYALTRGHQLTFRIRGDVGIADDINSVGQSYEPCYRRGNVFHDLVFKVGDVDRGNDSEFVLSAAKVVYSNFVYFRIQIPKESYGVVIDFRARGFGFVQHLLEQIRQSSIGISVQVFLVVNYRLFQYLGVFEFAVARVCCRGKVAVGFGFCDVGIVSVGNDVVDVGIHDAVQQRKHFFKLYVGKSQLS